MLVNLKLSVFSTYKKIFKGLIELSTLTYITIPIPNRHLEVTSRCPRCRTKQRNTMKDVQGYLLDNSKYQIQTLKDTQFPIAKLTLELQIIQGPKRYYIFPARTCLNLVKANILPSIVQRSHRTDTHYLTRSTFTNGNQTPITCLKSIKPFQGGLIWNKLQKSITQLPNI